MKNVVYLSYGKGVHTLEAIFSLLSAFKFITPSRSDYRFLVYTDNPDQFAGMRVTVEKLTQQQLDEWAQPHTFPHRRKICVMQHALAHHPAPTLVVDSDTYFRSSPDELFERIGPGRSVMHLIEGEIPEHWSEYIGVRFTDRTGREQVITEKDRMWNSGVVGMDPADAPLTAEMLHMADAVYPTCTWLSEQVSYWYWLSRQTKLQEAKDVVFHYWGRRYRPTFQAELQRFMPTYESLPEPERVRACYTHRPRATGLRRAKLAVKNALQTVGILRGNKLPARSE